MGWARDKIPGYKKYIDPAVQFVKGIVSVFTGGFGLDFDAPDFSSNQSEGIQGVLLNKDSAIANIPVVYGTRAVGGIRVFVSTGSGSNEYLYVAYVLSEGQVNGYNSLRIDDNTVSIANRSHGVRSVATSGNYATESRLEVQFFDGRDDQVASSLLQEAPGWTSDHKLSGLAYIACKFRWKKIENETDANNNPYSGGVPQLVAVLEGKKVFDVVSGYAPIEYATINSANNPDGYTINSAGTQAFKTATVSATNELLTQFNSRPNTVVINSARTDAEIKITINATVSNSNNAYADYQLGVTLTDQNGTSVKSVNSNTIRQIRLDDGVVSDSFEIILPLDSELNQNPYLVEPWINLRSLNGTVTASYSITVEVLTFEVPGHTVSYTNDTKVFSDNPANILLDYMRNNRYGKGLPNESIDWLSFRRAATLCNQVVNYTDSVTGKAFTCNAVIETGQTLMDNIRLILIGFRGIMPYQQGRYVLKIEHGGDDFDITATPTVPPVAFVATNDEILGGISIAGDSKRTKINRCKVTYVDPLSDFQPNEVIYPADGSADDVTFLAEDGVRLEKDVTLNMITNREQALQAAEVFVKRSRNFKQVSLATNMAGSNLTVGDLFRVINDRLGLNGVFRVVEISINEEGNIEISGFEHQSSAYGINAKGADIVRPTLSLPNPDLVEAPTGITVSSGAAFNIDNGAGYVESDATSRRLFVDWTETTDPFVRDYIVQFKESTEADFVNYTITTVPGIYITPVTLGTIYNVRVAARNELDRRSNFAEATAHTVIA